jgi:hypothetical protein
MEVGGFATVEGLGGKWRQRQRRSGESRVGEGGGGGGGVAHRGRSEGRVIVLVWFGPDVEAGGGRDG